jgi:hypothetical protein
MVVVPRTRGKRRDGDRGVWTFRLHRMVRLVSERQSTRFVMLEHSGHGPLHWDLMLEQGETLATWRLAARPDVGLGETIYAERLADHRLAYLDYEGPVSGGRGEVRRIDRGSWRPIETEATHWQVEFDGQVLSGGYELRRGGADSRVWSFRRLG